MPISEEKKSTNRRYPQLANSESFQSFCPLTNLYPYYPSEGVATYKLIEDLRLSNLIQLVYKKLNFFASISVIQQRALTYDPASLPIHQKSSVSTTVLIGDYLPIQFISNNFVLNDWNLKDLSSTFQKLHSEFINSNPANIFFFLGSLNTLTMPNIHEYGIHAYDIEEIDEALKKFKDNITFRTKEKLDFTKKYNELLRENPINEAYSLFYKFCYKCDLYTRLMKLKYILEYFSEPFPLFKPSFLSYKSDGDINLDQYPLMSYKDRIFTGSYSPLDSIGLQVLQYNSLPDNVQTTGDPDSATAYMLAQLDLSLYETGGVALEKIKKIPNVKLKIYFSEYAKGQLREIVVHKKKKVYIFVRSGVNDIRLSIVTITTEILNQDDKYLEFDLEGVALSAAFDEKRTIFDLVLVYRKENENTSGSTELGRAKVKCFINQNVEIGMDGYKRECPAFHEVNGKNMGNIVIEI